MRIAKLIIGLIVLAIGVYMIATNWGPVSSPLLSGVAFTLLGGLFTVKFFVCRGHHDKGMKMEGMKMEGGM